MLLHCKSAQTAAHLHAGGPGGGDEGVDRPRGDRHSSGRLTVVLAKAQHLPPDQENGFTWIFLMQESHSFGNLSAFKFIIMNSGMQARVNTTTTPQTAGKAEELSYFCSVLRDICTCMLNI